MRQLRDDFVKQGHIQVAFFHQLVVLAKSAYGFDGIFHDYSTNSAPRQERTGVFALTFNKCADLFGLFPMRPRGLKTTG